MAYSELIKNFDRIRDYMRQFYVYGFKSRNEYNKKSARSYDNERRRIESWLGDFMSFRQTADGKNVFLSVDSRSIPRNPLYNAFKAKSFTAGDVTFHFYVLDLLQDGSAYNAQEIVDLFSEKYLCHFDTDWEPDISTVRRNLKEYVSLGLLKIEKRGRELVFSRNDSSIALSAWANTLAFFAEADPLGVVGSFLLVSPCGTHPPQRLAEKPIGWRLGGRKNRGLLSRNRKQRKNLPLPLLSTHSIPLSMKFGFHRPETVFISAGYGKRTVAWKQNANLR